jgi:nicotinamidase-related amidase
VGGTVYPTLFEALVEYEEKFFRMVDYVTKGSNPYTEHYSAVKAEVTDPADPGTMLNARLITTLQNADVIAIAGEALDYCVANTMRDIMNNFGEDNIKKMVILTDATSPVGFPAGLDEAFMNEFINRGGKTCETTEFFA